MKDWQPGFKNMVMKQRLAPGLKKSFIWMFQKSLSIFQSKQCIRKLRNMIYKAMQLNIKLYGTLSRSFDEYDHLSGMDITLPEGSSINDLLVYLNILSKRVGMILMNDSPVQKDTQIKNEAQIKILQPIAGG
ncbi:MAG: hypothetical protein DRH26_14460 [Deltaproteobacteria bacterium]|nr:MAG: hypothetical protein DRH26_14460 [Deltaproteobacteria bacterium]